MTCIVGLQTDDNIFIAGDRSSSDIYSVGRVHDPKIAWVGDGSIVIGYAGSFRFGQILEHHLTVPFHYPDMSDYNYLVSQLVEQIRLIMTDCGMNGTEDGFESNASNALIVYNGGLWTLQEDYSIIRSADPFISIGTGSYYALGAMHGMAMSDTNFNKNPEHFLTTALQVAEYCDPRVSGPFDMVNVGLEEEEEETEG